MLDQAIGTATDAAANLARTEKLFARKVATQSTLDAVRTAAEQAESAVVRAEATLKRFSPAALDERADMVVASRNVGAAKADLARARLDLERALTLRRLPARSLISLSPPARRFGGRSTALG